ncbi:Fasciclin-like arabinogalactan protein [Actinidia chinensis var. chinensis]|uniref:Fasciclin-like arabinogalactan protein n=1 Tax=Actinidia chinensis var. chinensis TaxID=1590841 RepID=A0A2R6R6F4_ACTCC|nr:Fasciclin-like arabinogalactan protein [Actinidia chinensis var. chinensis]
MGVLHLLFFTLSITTISTKAHNITQILSPFPDYTTFNNLLTQTKLADEINSRQTITVLVVNNAAISDLASKHPLSVIKNALSLLVLLDYFDGAKLHQLSGGASTSTTTTTLYQTTGTAEGNLGFVNITDLKGGKVGFGSAAPGSASNSAYKKEVKKIPYNISVLEVTEPIIAPGILSTSAPEVNITARLEKAGCKTFAALISSTGVVIVYQASADKGLTVFAPSDEAFRAPNAPDLSKLTNAELVSILQYHALASYSPIGTLKTAKGPISTMATNGAGKFDLTVTSAGDEVTLKTGVDSSRIASTLIDSTPLCIFTVDSVLLPPELFEKAPAPAPAPAGEPAISPLPSHAPVVSAPSKAPVSAKAPASVFSPPAPPLESPVGGPAEEPSEAADTADSAAGEVKFPALVKAVLSVSATVIISVFLS